MYLRVSRINNKAILPTRAHPTDAGLDIYAPDNFNGDNPYDVQPGESILIYTGLKVEIPFGYMGMLCNKSGVASKKNLILGAHIIDTYYSGELIVNLHNIGTTNAWIAPGDKLVQLILVPIACSGVVEVPESELYEDFKIVEYREEKGFGSSDKKE